MSIPLGINSMRSLRTPAASDASLKPELTARYFVAAWNDRCINALLFLMITGSSAPMVCRLSTIGRPISRAIAVTRMFFVDTPWMWTMSHHRTSRPSSGIEVMPATTFDGRLSARKCMRDTSTPSMVEYFGVVKSIAVVRTRTSARPRIARAISCDCRPPLLISG
jgi:hypothetical protein